jgi:phosphoribosylaminoimidazole (AIR) synthetase
MGIGLIVVAAADKVTAIQTALSEAGEANSVVLGDIETGASEVRYV